MTHSIIGITLAFSSGLLIGSSFILQKVGLIQISSQEEEYGYLKNKVWWTGLICMICGELCNFGAYAFAPAIIVTPLGAVSVVVSAILSVFLLGERLSFPACMGILLCIIGSVLIVLHAPASTQTEQIPEFFSYVLSPGFLVYSCIALIVVCILVFRLGPKYGQKQPLIYLSITSISGAFLVNAAQGLGSSVVYSISTPNDTQFKYWSMYIMIIFAVFCAIFQINYLNKSLRYYSASIVTPLNYVFFSTATLITSAVLFHGMAVSAVDATQVFLGFIVIIIGVSLIFQFHLKEKVNKMRREAAAIEIRVSDEDASLAEKATRGLVDENHLAVPFTDEATATVHDLDPVNLWFQTYPLDNEHMHMTRKRKTKSITSTESVNSGGEEVAVIINVPSTPSAHSNNP